NVDVWAVYLTGIGTLLLLAIPFIPGLRDIPRLIPVHRLIWRDKDYGQEPAPKPAAVGPTTAGRSSSPRPHARTCPQHQRTAAGPDLARPHTSVRGSWARRSERGVWAAGDFQPNCGAALSPVAGHRPAAVGDGDGLHDR